jgi:membrane-bound lytic murein transglycosylase MltF
MNLGLVVVTVLLTLPVFSAEIQKKASSMVSTDSLTACCVPWMGLDLANELSRGPDCELFEAFSKHLGREGKTIIQEWPTLFERSQNNETNTDLFERKKCDLYATNITKNEERLKFVDVFPYYSSRIVVVVNASAKFRPKKASDLKGRQTAVVPETSFARWVDSFNSDESNPKKRIKAQIIPRGGSLKMLEKGEIDFALMDYPQALFVASRMNAQVQLAFPVGGHGETGWAFPKGSKSLQKEFGKFIEIQKKQKNSELTQIFLKYFGMTVAEFESVSMSAQ